MRRGRGLSTMRVDGAGQRMRREAQLIDSQRRAREADEQRRLEERRKTVKAPVLRTLAQIEEVVTDAPKSPFYVISREQSIKDIGSVVFGKESYNRVKKQTTKNKIGPHFDAYARHFSPWTIHVNDGSMGYVRGAFLPEDQWLTYVESTKDLTLLDEFAQSRRFKIGKDLFGLGDKLWKSPLVDGSITLLWHGDLSKPDLPGPSVHEFLRLPDFVTNAGLTSLRRSNDASYTIYARQIENGSFEDFIEV